MVESLEFSVEGNSPRSAVLPTPDRMTAGGAPMNEPEKSSTPPEGGAAQTAKKLDPDQGEDTQGQRGADKKNYDAQKGNGKSEEPESPAEQTPPYGTQLTPQPQGGGSGGGQYPHYPSQVTPASPSPAPTAVFTDAYGAAFLRPQSGGGGAFMPHSNPFGQQQASPLSPPRPTVMASGIPPNSPLFPRLSGGQPTNLHPSGLERAMGQPQQAPASPTLAYTTTSAAGATTYANYASAAAGTGGMTATTLQSTVSTDESQLTPGGWMDASMASTQYAQNSPQLSTGAMPMYGIPMGRANSGGRAASFDEPSMLPPSALDGQDPGNPNYSPYSQASSTGGTLFQQPWGYQGMPEMYSNNQVAPLQPRPTHHMHMGYGMPQMRGMGPYGAYYPACSPGPPIQTTASNKGPQGSNLFVFHIPNNMTNMDMFQLFSPYGNLISVRIMVEKDSGRSRGFGFVSYDNPESAALAIKELNGFAIGNKRLKVQHKQIRPRDVQQERDHIHGYSGVSSDGGYDRQQQGTALPPSGPSAANTWFGGPSGGEMSGQVSDPQEAKPDEATEQTSTSTNGEAQLNMSNDVSKGMVSPLATLGTLQDSLPEAPGREE